MKVSSSDSKNPKFMIIISVEMTINSKKAYNDKLYTIDSHYTGHLSVL